MDKNGKGARDGWEGHQIVLKICPCEGEVEGRQEGRKEGRKRGRRKNGREGSVYSSQESCWKGI